MSKWNSENISRSPDIYEEFKFWNKRLDNYRNKTKSESVFSNYSLFFWNMNFGVAIRYVKENNKTIKTVHRKELMKVIEFKKSGTSPEEIYKLKMG
jgi:hypothetical protein